MAGRAQGRLLIALLSAAACGSRAHLETAETAPPAPLSPAAEPAQPVPPPPVRPQLDGRGFPDKVLALTWDDGPDENTLALASYLSSQHVTATFFVVREWSSGLSADPGFGAKRFETGYEYLPILGDLVQLGHRLGNHTSNHVLLSEVDAAVVDDEIRDNQERIDPFLTNELRLFRAPGGAWSASASRAADADPYLVDLVGPVRWDVDRKDWGDSVDCDSSRPALECEASGPERVRRLRAGIVARRYVEAIEAAGRGIVLLHDRVGDVGSSYALDLAAHLVPELTREGFVFAAPVLRFVGAARRLSATAGGVVPRVTPRAALQLGDLDGDRRADACIRADGDRRCARSEEVAGTAADRRPKTVFVAQPRSAGSCEGRLAGDAIRLGDVDGDGRADACSATEHEVDCALATTSGECAPARTWLRWSGFAAARFGGFALGDLDGDGRADVCARRGPNLVCALSTGHRFGPDTPWARLVSGAPGDGPTDDTEPALADVDGDGRADACWRAGRSLSCARSTGRRFSNTEIWSTDPALVGSAPWLFGDLNGDARCDVCALAFGAIRCALSTRKGFTASSTWLEGGASPEAERMLGGDSLALGDVNGDGRADLCSYGANGLACALAP